MKKHILAAAIALSTFGESFSQNTKLPETKDKTEEVDKTRTQSAIAITAENESQLLSSADWTEASFEKVMLSSGGTRTFYHPDLDRIVTNAGPSEFTGKLWVINPGDENMTEVGADIIYSNDAMLAYNYVKDINGDLVKLNYATGERTTVQEALVVDRYIQVLELSDGNILTIGSLGEGIGIFDGTTYTKPTTPIPDIGDCKSITPASDGGAYITCLKTQSGNQSQFVFKYDLTTQTLTQLVDHTIADKRYDSVIEDAEGNLIVHISSLILNTANTITKLDDLDHPFIVDSTSNFNAAVTGTAMYFNENGEFITATLYGAADAISVHKEIVAPTINTPIPDQVLDEDFGVTTVDLSSLTTDPTDVITRGSVSPAGIVEVVVINGVDGPELQLTSVDDENTVNSGPITVTLDATNAAGQTAVGIDTLEITINALNDAPTLTSTITAFATEDEAYTYAIIGNDVDGDALIFTVSNLPAWLSFDGSNVISGTPSNDEVGEYLFSISINDGIIVTDTDVALIVENVNDAPTFTSATTVSATEDEAFSYTIIGNDIDRDALTFAVSNLPSWLSFDATDIISGTPSNDEVGDHILSVSIQDGTVSVDTDIVVTVANVNDAPTLTSATTASATEDEAFSYTIIGNDIDGDALTFAVSNLPSWLSFDNTDQITGTPTNDEVGDHILNVIIQDGTVSIDTEIKLTVANVNDAPEISSIANQDIDAGKELAGVLFIVTDVDNEILLSDISAASSNQALVADSDISIIALADNQYELQLKASEGVSGVLSISVAVSDGELSTTANFDITVNLVLSIEDQSTTASITLSPNPVIDMLSIEYATSSDYQYSIYSIEGQLMFQDYIQKSNQAPIDVSYYPQGMYIMHLKPRAGIAIQRKFIKK